MSGYEKKEGSKPPGQPPLSPEGTKRVMVILTKQQYRTLEKAKKAIQKAGYSASDSGFIRAIFESVDDQLPELFIRQQQQRRKAG